jgi:hypothetical protein
VRQVVDEGILLLMAVTEVFHISKEAVASDCVEHYLGHPVVL